MTIPRVNELIPLLRELLADKQAHKLAHLVPAVADRLGLSAAERAQKVGNSRETVIYFRVYDTLRKMEASGIVWRLGSGYFQLRSANAPFDATGLVQTPARTPVTRAPRAPSRADLFEEILHNAGTSLHYRTIHRLAVERTGVDFKQAVANATLHSSARFRRTGAGMYGLTGWHGLLPDPAGAVQPYGRFEAIALAHQMVAKNPLLPAKKVLALAHAQANEPLRNGQALLDFWHLAGFCQKIDFAVDAETPLHISVPLQVGVAELRRHCLKALCAGNAGLGKVLAAVRRLPAANQSGIQELTQIEPNLLKRKLALLADFGALRGEREGWTLTKLGEEVLEMLSDVVLPGTETDVVADDEWLDRVMDINLLTWDIPSIVQPALALHEESTTVAWHVPRSGEYHILNEKNVSTEASTFPSRQRIDYILERIKESLVSATKILFPLVDEPGAVIADHIWRDRLVLGDKDGKVAVWRGSYANLSKIDQKYPRVYFDYVENILDKTTQEQVFGLDFATKIANKSEYGVVFVTGFRRSDIKILNEQGLTPRWLGRKAVHAAHILTLEELLESSQLSLSIYAVQLAQLAMQLQSPPIRQTFTTP